MMGSMLFGGGQGGGAGAGRSTPKPKAVTEKPVAMDLD